MENFEFHGNDIDVLALICGNSCGLFGATISANLFDKSITHYVTTNIDYARPIERLVDRYEGLEEKS